MNSFAWLLVLVPIFVVAIYLLFRRSTAATPFNSIYQSTADHTHEEAVSAGCQKNEDQAPQRPRAHGGCCGLTR